MDLLERVKRVGSFLAEPSALTQWKEPEFSSHYKNWTSVNLLTLLHANCKSFFPPKMCLCEKGVFWTTLIAYEIQIKP